MLLPRQLEIIYEINPPIYGCRPREVSGGRGPTRPQ
jgi:hypothetical protein